jgi:hypothetical protein
MYGYGRLVGPLNEKVRGLCSNVIDIFSFLIVHSLFDNMFVFELASALLMVGSSLFHATVGSSLFHARRQCVRASTLLETAISNVDSTLVQMERSFDEEFHLYVRRVSFVCTDTRVLSDRLMKSERMRPSCSRTYTPPPLVRVFDIYFFYSL